jgi:hypothetical protein
VDGGCLDGGGVVREDVGVGTVVVGGGGGGGGGNRESTAISAPITAARIANKPPITAPRIALLLSWDGCSTGTVPA